MAVGDNADLKVSVFPEKKKLSVKKDFKVVTLNKENDSASPITVNDMLAAAEGRTDDTKDKSDPSIAMARAAKVGMWACTLALIFAAAGEIVPSIDAVLTMDPEKILPHPLVILGALDIVPPCSSFSESSPFIPLSVSARRSGWVSSA